MNIRAWLLALLLNILPACGSPARADSGWGGSAALTSDYVYRGVSQTYLGPALQLAATYQGRSGWYAGAWGSNVNPYPFQAHALELNFFGGWVVPLGDDWRVRFAYTHLLYAFDRRPASYDYDDLAVSIAFQDWLSARIAYEPNASGYSAVDYGAYVHDRGVLAYEASLRWPLASWLSIQGSGGYYDLSRLFGVRYWAGSAGLALHRGHLELGLQRFITDGGVRRLYDEASADGRWAATVLWRF